MHNALRFESHQRRLLSASLLLAGLVLCPGSLNAQGLQRNRSGMRPSVTRPTQRNKTSVSLVLLTKSRTAAFRARGWRSTLQKLGVPFRIRRSTSADKIETRESKMGTFRKVTAVGRFHDSGKLIFAERTFTRSDAAKLAEWIRELQTYGAKGRPQGKPLWGLTKSRFGSVFAALSSQVTKEVQGESLTSAVGKLGLPAKYPVRYSVAAKSAMDGKTFTVRKMVKGHSAGTALALVLRDHGLGFRPLRTPRGSIEIVIDPLRDAPDAWPVGWKLKESRVKTAPKLFQLIPVELDKVKMTDVFHAITVKTGVPIHVDYHAIEAKGIDVDKLVVSYPARKASWSLLLRGITARRKLTRVLRIDEAGKPFVWITPFVPRSGSR